MADLADCRKPSPESVEEPKNKPKATLKIFKALKLLAVLDWG